MQIRTAAVILLCASLIVCCRNPLTRLHDFKSEIRLKGYKNSSISQKLTPQMIIESVLKESGLEWAPAGTKGLADKNPVDVEYKYEVSLWKSGPDFQKLNITMHCGIDIEEPYIELEAFALPYNLLRYANRIHLKLVRKIRQELAGEPSLQVLDHVEEGKADPIIPPGTQVW